MANASGNPTATDYVVTALSPLLIMSMVGSFVFFLVEVLYEGAYTERLLYTVFFFVVAAVLIARIAIELGSGRAGVYALALGLVTYFALQAYVSYPAESRLAPVRGLVHLGLLLLIWWCAHKLTWDCTYIDERRQSDGRGLLAAAGLTSDGIPALAASSTTAERAAADYSRITSNDPTSPAASTRGDALSHKGGKRRQKRRRKTVGDSRLWSWIEAYQRHREQQRRRPHTPGVWVLYCTLVALPIFALGQSLIDPADTSRRQATFWHVVVFIGSALGLLATTSLLGLRRYLRQKRTRIPATFTGGWLLLATGLIIVFIVIGALLPRPHSETPWFGWSRAGSSTRDASRYATLKDNSSGQGEGAPGPTDRNRKVKTGSEPSTSDPSTGPPSSSTGKGKQPTASKSNGNPSHDLLDKSSPRDSGRNQDVSNKSNSPPENATGKSSASNPDEPRPGLYRPTPQDNSGTASGGRQADSRHDGTGRNVANPSAIPPGQPQVTPGLSRLATILKWLVFVLVALLVAIAVIVAVLRGLAPFTRWAQRLLDAWQRWWQQLWHRTTAKRPVTKSELPDSTTLMRPPSWSSFSNPYTDGSAMRRPPQEVLDYTLLAWEAWAYELGCPRAANETVWEFLNRLATVQPEATAPLQQLAWLHAQVAYGAAPIPVQQLHSTLRLVWTCLPLP
ncbi:MAG: DUF4129 domain-containing protein [Gemmataceae bacterium]|nr:DUF4129 domain-containing protein [Gemmataceae bacterium]MDW8241856.1 DUF4129 domain-containing protein [Thermogemmata sp.]